MSCMFFNCEKFNENLNKWNVSNMNGIFYGCTSLNRIYFWFINKHIEKFKIEADQNGEFIIKINEIAKIIHYENNDPVLK